MLAFNPFHPSSAVVLAILLALVLPLVSSLVARFHWPTEVQALITLALSTLTGFLTAWKAAADAGHLFSWRTAAGFAIGTYVVAVLARVNLWAGTNIDAKLLAVGNGPHKVTEPMSSGHVGEHEAE